MNLSLPRARPDAWLLLLAMAAQGCDTAPAYSAPLAGDAVRSSLPMTFDHDLPFVDVQVGSQTARLLVDTGSFETITLRDGILPPGSYEETGGGIMKLDATGRKSVLNRVIVPEVRLGRIALRDVKCFIGPSDESYPNAARMDGVLGLGLLERFTLTFDAKGGELTLASGEATAQAAPTGWRAIPLHRQRDGIMTTGASGDRSLRILWDTGASHSVIRPHAARGSPRRTEGRYEVVTLGDLSIEGEPMGDIEFVELDYRHPNADAILGNNVLLERAFRIDFARRQIAIAPRP